MSVLTRHLGTQELMLVELEALVTDFARGVAVVDALRPQAANARTGVPFQAGIGPHPESRAVQLVSRALGEMQPERYNGRVVLGVSYPGTPRQKCDDLSAHATSQ